MKVAWTRRGASASGQVFEFRLWAALVEQSVGQLHVFLPLSDRGIDAMVHRLEDGTYFRVQAKGRSSLIGGEVRLAVWASALVDDGALIVGGLTVDDGLGPTILVVPAGEFKQLAELTSSGGEPVYSMSFGMRPRSDSRWLPYLVSMARLVEMFGVTPSPRADLVEPEPEPRPSWHSDLGFLGEAEVTRRLAEPGDLNLFRPFPDLETSELVALHVGTRKVLGLQVKTIGIDSADRTGVVRVFEPSFRASKTTYFVVVAWLRDEHRFDEEALLVPSEDMSSVSEREEGTPHLRFEWTPGLDSEDRVARYRIQLRDLGQRIEQLLG